MPTLEETDALAEAVWQVLDDMGQDGLCCCLAAKAQLRVAYEPFWTEQDEPMDMSLAVARSILDDVGLVPLKK